MLKYQDQIASDPLDPLHDLLDDLESAPTVSSLLGICKNNVMNGEKKKGKKKT